jgi:putative addiction module component (TIGR02574 family)
MTTTIEELRKEALRLSPEDRVKLAGDLLDSVGSDEQGVDVDAAWAAELKRRLDDDENVDRVTVAELEAELLETIKKARGT